jgi:hypothetical protein
VDNYPRAFEFHVRETSGPVVLQPEEDLSAIRIVSPHDLDKFNARQSITTKIEVDTPEGFDNVDGNFIQVGVDRKGLRNLTDGAEVIKRKTDRDVNIFARSPAETGTLIIEPKIDDYKLKLPTAGINGQEVYVIGQIVARGTPLEESISHYIRIVLDGEKPTLGPITLNPDGTKLKVGVIPTDKLTGIQIVKAAFDAQAPEEIKWIDGKPGIGGQWLIELETAELPLGEHTVLVNAFDKVGNSCERPEIRKWTKAPDTAVPKAGPVAPGNTGGAPKVVKNSVRGKVIHGRNTVREIEVALIGAGAPTQPAKIGDGQTFDFGLVASGTYTLRASGLSANGHRTAEMQITVSDQPNDPLRLGDVILK